MDTGAGQSQTIISSFGTSNQISDPQCGADSQSNDEFVKHGLILWHETRQHWLRNRKPQKQTELREPAISWNATYKSLLGTTKPFRKPIPLGEMIDFLVDIWEEEGMYD